MKIWLDDDRPAPKGWVWVKTADEAIAVLDGMANASRADHITHMSFDHDLADVHYEWVGAFMLDENHPLRKHAEIECAKEKTGYDVILWMAEHNIWPTEECRVHTHNSVRGPVMADMINRYGPYETKVRWTPYQPSPEEIRELMGDV